MDLRPNTNKATPPRQDAKWKRTRPWSCRRIDLEIKRRRNGESRHQPFCGVVESLARPLCGIRERKLQRLSTRFNVPHLICPQDRIGRDSWQRMDQTPPHLFGRYGKTSHGENDQWGKWFQQSVARSMANLLGETIIRHRQPRADRRRNPDGILWYDRPPGFWRNESHATIPCRFHRDHHECNPFQQFVPSIGPIVTIFSRRTPNQSTSNELLVQQLVSRSPLIHEVLLLM